MIVTVSYKLFGKVEVSQYFDLSFAEAIAEVRDLFPEATDLEAYYA